MGLWQSYKNLTNSKAYNIVAIFVGIGLIATGFEQVWPVILGIFVIGSCTHRLYKISTS